MRLKLTNAAICSVAWLGLATSSFASEVWVVTDTSHPTTLPVGVRRIELDAPDRILSKLNLGLPADPRRAAAEATRRVEASSVLYQELAIAYQGIVDAWSLGVTTVPAVIVDRRYVVYGEPNVEQALELIQTFKGSHQ